MAMPLFPVITTAIAGFATLLWIAILTVVPHIEDDLSTRVGAALRDPDLQWVQTAAIGQSVHLTGYVPSYDAKTNATSTAASIWGVGAVVDEIVVVGTTTTCQEGIDEMLSRERIQFAPGSTAVHESSHFLLKMLAVVALNCDATIEIAGHTDSYGNPITNQKTSEARAEAVRDYLISSGVKPERLKAIGYGETKPLYDTGTEEGRRRNRRIEFRVLGSQTS